MRKANKKIPCSRCERMFASPGAMKKHFYWSHTRKENQQKEKEIQTEKGKDEIKELQSLIENQWLAIEITLRHIKNNLPKDKESLIRVMELHNALLEFVQSNKEI